MKKAIFLADAHLKSPKEKDYRDLLLFLDNLKDDKELDSIFLLGDLFDFFVGFPKIIFYEHLKLIEKLQYFAERDVNIFYFEGNHDFFLKKLNKTGFDVNIIENSLDLYLGGNKFFLSHGDRIDKTDYAHRTLSFFVKNPLTNLLSYLLPPYLVYDFAHMFSRFSRENISSKRLFKTTLFIPFAKECVNKGYYGAILGHFHKSMIIQPDENIPIPLFLVGSWKENQEYLEYDMGQFTFKKFSSVSS